MNSLVILAINYIANSKLLFNSVVAYGVNHKTIDKCKKIFLTLQWIV